MRDQIIPVAETEIVSGHCISFLSRPMKKYRFNISTFVEASSLDFELT